MGDILKISVDFYNETEKDFFQKYPNIIKINKIIGKDIEISKDEFSGYMMFIDQMDRDGFRTYEELSQRISQRIGDMDDFLSFENDSIQAIMSSSEMHQVRYTERIGVALGLCIINKIHGLTFADWKKIPETSGRNAHPTFDFDLLQNASTGDKYIQVENKGSVVPDNTLSTSVSNHYSGKHGILKKKKYIRDEEKKQGIQLHKNLYYGTIGVLDNINNAKVWLVDPPAFKIDLDPKRYKLLARLHYYLDEFKNIGVKKSITNALAERIKLIAFSNDFTQYNNKPLLGKFYKSEFVQYMQDKYHTTVDTNEAFGKTIFVNHGKSTYCYLMAMPKVLMRLIVNQNFEDILDYSYNPEFINNSTQILIRVSTKMENESNSVENLNFVYNERLKVKEAVFYGRVSYTSDGRVFGLIGYETSETPKGNNGIDKPIVIRREKFGANSIVKEQRKTQSQKKFGYTVKSQKNRSVELLSLKFDTSYSYDGGILKKTNKLKPKIKESNDFDLLAEID